MGVCLTGRDEGRRHLSHTDSVRSGLNPKKAHLEAKRLSFCLQSLPRSHSFCSPPYILLSTTSSSSPPILTHLSHCCVYPPTPLFLLPVLFPLFSHKSDFMLYAQSSQQPRLFMPHQTIPMKPKHFKLLRAKCNFGMGCCNRVCHWPDLERAFPRRFGCSIWPPPEKRHKNQQRARLKTSLSLEGDICTFVK